MSCECSQQHLIIIKSEVACKFSSLKGWDGSLPPLVQIAIRFGHLLPTLKGLTGHGKLSISNRDADGRKPARSHSRNPLQMVPMINDVYPDPPIFAQKTWSKLRLRMRATACARPSPVCIENRLPCQASCNLQEYGSAGHVLQDMKYLK